MKVQFVVLIFAAVGLLVGCAGSGSDDPKVSALTPPQVSGAPQESTDETSRALLTPDEVTRLKVKIKARTEHFAFQSLNEKTKRFLAGTILHESLLQVHPLDVDELTESELAKVINYFFDTDFNFKK